MLRPRRLDAAALAGIAAGALTLAVPLVVRDPYVLKVLTFAGINVIVVVGLSLLFGYAGQISLGHAAFVGLGAYTSAVLTTALGWPPLVAIAAAVALAASAGALLALPVLRLRGHYLAMATLGFGEIMVIAFREAKGITGGTDGLTGIPPASIGALKVASPAANYLLVWAVAIVAYALVRNVVRLRPGRALRALHASEAGARACGIDISRAKVQVFTLSAGLAGLAGALYAHFTGFISPSSFALDLSIVLVTMVALGGMASLPGAVAGAVLLTLLPYIDAFIPGLPRDAVAVLQDWQTDIYAVVLIAVMVFAPAGLAGMARRATARRPAEEASR